MNNSLARRDASFTVSGPTVIKTENRMIPCPSSNGEEEVSPQPSRFWRDICMVDQTENRMIIPFEVNGVIIEALIDSGARSSLIDLTTVTELNLDFSPLNRDIYGFGEENKVNIIGKVMLNGVVKGIEISS